MATAPSLLITDDDQGFRETLQSVFEPMGFRTLQAADGEEALEIVRAEPVHLLLLDMHMPKMTGIETARLVHQTLRSLPCILMSAELDDEIIDQAKQAEVFSVLPKPVTRRQIMGVVERALRSAYGWPDRSWTIRVRAVMHVKKRPATDPRRPDSPGTEPRQ